VSSGFVTKKTHKREQQFVAKAELAVAVSVNGEEVHFRHSSHVDSENSRVDDILKVTCFELDYVCGNIFGRPSH